MELQTIIAFLSIGFLVGFVAGVGVTVWFQLAGRFLFFHINEPGEFPFIHALESKPNKEVKMIDKVVMWALFKSLMAGFGVFAFGLACVWFALHLAHMAGWL
jgi:hypothetical protein